MKYLAIKIFLDVKMIWYRTTERCFLQNIYIITLQNDSQVFLSLLSYNYETSK